MSFVIENMKRILILSFLFFTNFVLAQNDTIPLPKEEAKPIIETPQDSTKKKKNNFIVRYWREDYPNPKKAAVLSLILPGAGQIYNKKGWWYKLPVVYGGLGASFYFLRENTKQYKYLRDQYKYLVDEDELTMSDFQIAVDQGLVQESTIKAERIKFNKWRQSNYAIFVASYLLVASEAYVQAHLLSFDVSDDLSMKINPKLMITPHNEWVTGVGLKFQIKSKQKEIPQFSFTSP